MRARGRCVCCSILCTRRGEALRGIGAGAAACTNSQGDLEGVCLG